ncbi:hypothetical protein [Streptomyces sp. NPDC101165]|uniref:hypothetical protein n=1 Tax=Streptomyces sp. NPDC101165 TaxID=3366119 RepID=UPI0037F7D608
MTLAETTADEITAVAFEIEKHAESMPSRGSAQSIEATWGEKQDALTRRLQELSLRMPDAQLRSRIDDACALLSNWSFFRAHGRTRFADAVCWGVREDMGAVIRREPSPATNWRVEALQTFADESMSAGSE